MDKYIPSFTVSNEMIKEYGTVCETVGRLSYLDKIKSNKRMQKIGKLKKIKYIIGIEDDIEISTSHISLILDGKNVSIKEELVDKVKAVSKILDNIEKYTFYSNLDFASVYKIVDRNASDEIFDEPEKDNKTTVDLIHSIQGKKTHTRALLYEIKKNSIHSLIKAAFFHSELLFISPFKKNNSLMALIWQTLLLSSFKSIFRYIPFEEEIYKDLENYKKELEAAFVEKSSTPFIVYMLKLINRTLIKIEEETKDYFSVSSNKVNILMSYVTYFGQTAKQLMDKIGLKSLNSFRKNYINPALRMGVLKMSNPDKPTSKNQTYFKD